MSDDKKIKSETVRLGENDQKNLKTVQEQNAFSKSDAVRYSLDMAANRVGNNIINGENNTLQLFSVVWTWIPNEIDASTPYKWRYIRPFKWIQIDNGRRLYPPHNWQQPPGHMFAQGTIYSEGGITSVLEEFEEEVNWETVNKEQLVYWSRHELFCFDARKNIVLQEFNIVDTTTNIILFSVRKLQ